MFLVVLYFIKNRIVFLLLMLCICSSFAKSKTVSTSDSFAIAKLAIDLPYVSANGKPVLPIRYECASAKLYKLYAHCYAKLGTGDSQLVFSFLNRPFLLSKGIHTAHLPLSYTSDKYTYFAPLYAQVMHTIHALPCGQYALQFLIGTDSTSLHSYTFNFDIDSILTPTSVLKKDINTLLQQQLHFNEQDTSRISAMRIKIKPSQQLARLKAPIDNIFSKRGFTSTTVYKDGQHITNVYLSKWFLGRYVFYETSSIAQQVQATHQRVQTDIASFAAPNILSSNSLLSQVKTLLQSKDKHNELQGNIALSGNWSNAQPEYSLLDQNYYEMRADLTTKILNIPLSVESYYTTQDAHRKIKSSYFRVHYDVNSIKSELMSTVTSCANKFNTYSAQGENMAMQYGSLLNNLDKERQALLNALQHETGLQLAAFSALPSGLTPNLTAAFISKWADSLAQQATARITKSSDTLVHKAAFVQKAKLLADSLSRVYQKAMQRYQQALHLASKIKTYTNLLEQYRNTHYFDSVLGYAKIKSLTQGKDISVKELSKSAAEFLSEGQAKKVITGISNLDIGVFPNYISKYTMAGQQVKGIDVGYTLGAATTVGVTLGKTQYIGRDGSLQNYAAYAFKSSFKIAEHQRIQLIYYGYSPSLALFANDSFLKNRDITLPSFKDPLAILATTYEGRFLNRFSVNAELASAKSSHQDFRTVFDANKLAWNVQVEGAVPATTVLLKGAYEHVGYAFTNATLPIPNSGIEKYSVGAKGTFFNSFLSLGIEFNHLQQDHFGIRGGNNRWGFDLATHSKRYPSMQLSYKPYTTFRSFADTLAIPQQAILGAVWNGKLSYQFKNRTAAVWRIMANYTHSASLADTLHYQHEVAQVGVAYSNKIWYTNCTMGITSSLVDFPTTVGSQQAMRFAMLAFDKQMSKALRAGMSVDIGYALFGLAKYGMAAQIAYKFNRMPLSIRINGRSTNFQLTAEAPRQKLWSGGVDVVWRLKMKLS